MNQDRFMEAAGFDLALMRELNSRTKLTAPPSQHLQAWRNYERQKFAVPGRHPAPDNMGYNLWTDTARTLRWAHGVLTDPAYMKRTGFAPKTIARRALARVSEAIGYRYLRGLEVIACKLEGAELQKFTQERKAFCHTFEQAADAAHVINDKGQNFGVALTVVRLFANELLALCPWLEQVGQASGAAELRKGATLQ